MRKRFLLLLVFVALAFVSGCGSDRDKGMYRDQDKPRADDRDR